MNASDRRVREAFVALADRLVTDFDVLDFLELLAKRCVELLEVDAAGLLLADHRGTLKLVAASTEQGRVLELFQLQNREGPCLDCYRVGRAVHAGDLAAATDRWPQFAAAARAAGFGSAHALPMRLRDGLIGGLNLFDSQPGELEQEAIDLGQALADVATIGIMHERTVRDRDLVFGQLQTALNQRVVLDQAKGVLAEHIGTSVDDAHARLRAYARRTGRNLGELASEVVHGSADLAEIGGR
ncbi:MAG TPA: GAF and ANTAR domain-containing protein [Actinophytocola sp.]|uniref:GAF and ANTAR domain-containing protein n=1 Tax=Actinophytocola sp. TaxID=1872138 RepID=UPI002DBD1066|nr:GAF and ANTAR domain-containing protein [Actinophytocola sp.]HEU5475497.1 GAF and ANTAR domain-containing protein [Actinophytocola sp.]